MTYSRIAVNADSTAETDPEIRDDLEALKENGDAYF